MLRSLRTWVVGTVAMATFASCGRDQHSGQNAYQLDSINVKNNTMTIMSSEFGDPSKSNIEQYDIVDNPDDADYRIGPVTDMDRKLKGLAFAEQSGTVTGFHDQKIKTFDTERIYGLNEAGTSDSTFDHGVKQNFESGKCIYFLKKRAP